MDTTTLTSTLVTGLITATEVALELAQADYSTLKGEMATWQQAMPTALQNANGDEGALEVLRVDYEILSTRNQDAYWRMTRLEDALRSLKQANGAGR